MGTLAYQRALKKQQKTLYKGLSNEQKKYVKAWETFLQMERELINFFARCKRKASGEVDWSSLTEEELDLYEWQNKSKDKALSIMSKLEDIIDTNYTLNVFRQINTHSMSF